jgi:hypothetical protein
MTGVSLEMPENAILRKREAVDYVEPGERKDTHESISATPSESEGTPIKIQAASMDLLFKQLEGMA